jgi:hypothetical protein
MPVARIDGELHVGSTGVDADLAQHRNGGIAHQLIFLVGERLRRGNGDGIARMHAHRIEILDRADDDAVVLTIAHDLHFEFFPAEHRFLEQHFAGRRRIETALANIQKFFPVVGDTAAGAAEGERRADDGRKTDIGLCLARRIEIVDQHRARHVETDAAHGVAKLLTVFRLVDGFPGCTDHLDTVGRENAFSIQIERAVERRLPAHGRQQRVGALLLDNLRDRAPVDGLDIGRVRHLRIGHDGRRIRVHQHDTITLLAQRLAGLRAGVVELTGLADDDGARADDEHAFDVASPGHRQLTRLPSR